MDYSYSDYDYQPEEGRSLGAEDEYYEDIAPARAYNFQFQVHFLAKQTFVLDLRSDTGRRTEQAGGAGRGWFGDGKLFLSWRRRGPAHGQLQGWRWDWL